MAVYTRHFGLESPVVQDGIARDDQMFRGPAQQATLADLGTALCRSDSVVVVRGPAGSGKSTLAAAAFRESVTQLALGSLADTAQTPHEMLEQLLLEFGFTPYKQSRTERLSQWRQYLGEMAATGTRIGILVENADRLRRDVLVELERLTSADIRGVTGANLLLTVRGAFAELGTTDALTPLAQRCRRIVDVAPLSAEDTAAYLRFCVARAGGNWASIFDDGVDTALHAAARGIIRVVDSLLESCLARAALAGTTRVDLALLERVIAALPAPAAAGLAAETAETSPPAAETPQSPQPAPPDAEAPAVHATPPAQATPRAQTSRQGPAAEEARKPQNEREALVVPSPRLDPSASVATPAAVKPTPLAKPSTRPVPAPARADFPLPAPANAAQAQAGRHVEAGMATVAAAPAVAAATIAPVAPPARGARAESAKESPGEIPVLDDAVETVQGTAPSESVGDTLDGESVDDLLAPSTLLAALVGESPEPVADAPQARPADDSGYLSEEDREQIEMLEAFANAEALEQMSESMAETIFADRNADEIADALREANTRSGRS